MLGTAIVSQVLQTAIFDDFGAKLFIKKLLENFIIALLLLIVAIPEGLAITAGVSIAQATMRMLETRKILANEMDCSEKNG